MLSKDNFFDIRDTINNNNNSKSYNYHLLIIILTIIINFIILYLLNKISKCKCSNINESLYLKEWFIFSNIYHIILLTYFIFNGSNNNYAILIYLSIIMNILGIIMIIRLLLYIHKLKTINCNCDMSLEENIIYYYYIIGLSIISFYILIILILKILS